MTPETTTNPENTNVPATEEAPVTTTEVVLEQGPTKISPEMKRYLQQLAGRRLRGCRSDSFNNELRKRRTNNKNARSERRRQRKAA